MVQFVAGTEGKSIGDQFSAWRENLNTDKELQKKLAYSVGALLLIAVLAAVLIVNKPWALPQEEQVVVDKQSARNLSYLPEVQRTIEEPETLRDPFGGSITLKGIIKGDDGGDVAIIENGKSAYVATLNAQVANGWTVAEITANSVTLTSASQKVKLELNGRTKTEKIKPNPTTPAKGTDTAKQPGADKTEPAKDGQAKGNTASGGKQ